MNPSFDKDSVDKLKFFIGMCQTNPEILGLPEFGFFREYVESLGGKIPKTEKKMPTAEEVKPEEPSAESEESAESDIELDMEGCIKPEELDPNQEMGDAFKLEISEEEADKADEKRGEAMQQFSEGNFEKAVQLFTEAIVINPQSALLFAKRGQAFLKLQKPNACIKDCTRALQLNCDSAAAYKFRGRAYRLIGEFEKAAKDLRQACNIDFDEQSDEWLKEVTPNAKKIEQHRLKQERKKLEKEERQRAERLKKAREVHAKAAQPNVDEPGSDQGGQGGPGGPGIGDFYKLLQDPEVMAAFQDPEVAAAFQDISVNPANLLKYQSNPKIMALVTKLSSKFVGSGFPAGGFPAGFPGAGAFPKPPKGPAGAPDDDGLD